MISMFFNFLNPLSEVISGSCKNAAVAAMIASGVFIACCCLICIAIFLISGVNSIIIQSSNKAFSFLFSANDNCGHPNNSISEITDIKTLPSKKGSVFGIPSCTFIRKFVSAIKLIPFISYISLIGNTIQPAPEFAKVSAKRFFITFFRKSCNSFLHFLFSNRFFYLNNHTVNIHNNNLNMLPQ